MGHFTFNTFFPFPFHFFLPLLQLLDPQLIIAWGRFVQDIEEHGRLFYEVPRPKRCSVPSGTWYMQPTSGAPALFPFFSLATFE